MVKQFFITFSHKDIGSLSIRDIMFRLASLDKFSRIIGVVENHADNSNKHYHVLWLHSGKGLSKHTYRKDIRILFPEIRGHGLDVSGVRNIKHTLKYMLKDVTSPRNVHLINITLEELLKVRSLEMYTYFSILFFNGNTFEE